MRKWIGIIVGLLWCCWRDRSVLLIHAYIPKMKNEIRQNAQSYLENHFKSSVTFSDFHVSLYPGVHVTIDNLVLRHQGRTDIPPLVAIKQVSTHRRAIGSAAQAPGNFLNATLVGLQINTPPRVPGGSRRQFTERIRILPWRSIPFEIREVVADDALLTVLRFTVRISRRISRAITSSGTAQLEFRPLGPVPGRTQQSQTAGGDHLATGSFGPVAGRRPARDASRWKICI